MADRPSISVIVPAYQAGNLIDRCLEALECQTVPRESYEILVVDDGSRDETVDRVRSHDGVRLLNQAHAGPAAARNRGAEHARGDVLLFTDCDCEPAPDWIERMVTPLRSDGIVGVKGAYRSRQRETVARFVQMEYEDKYERMARQEYIDFIDTYAAGYRRDVYVANRGFDPTFPEASVEDQEFSFRLAGLGYRMVFVPEAHVYHRGHARNLRTYWQRKFKIGFWKVLVARRYPNKILHDSHTPQVLKLQVLLTGLAGLCLLGGLLWRPVTWGLGIVTLLFLLTTLPFAFKVWRKDSVVAVLSPGLLLVRALALGMGFAVGLVAHQGAIGRTGARSRVPVAFNATGYPAQREPSGDDERRVASGKTG